MAMTATEAHAQLKSKGVSQEQCDQLAAVGAINWQALIQLVVQYGPAIVQAILAIFAQPAPTPVPQPPVQRG